MSLVDFDKVAPILQVISQGCVLTYKILWILYIMFLKICQMNYYCAVYTVHCTVTQKPHGVTLQNHTSGMPNRINSVPWIHAITSTPYSDFTLSHQLCAMNEHGHTNSIPWMHAVCRLRQVTFIQFNQKIFWTNWVHSWYGVGVTAFIHGTELMWFGKVTLRSKKISTKWLWPVKVTLEAISSV